MAKVARPPVKSEDPEIKRRKEIVRRMKALQKRIKREFGNVPDIEGLIDAGREDEVS